MDPEAQRFIEGLVRAMSAEGVTTHFASDDPRLASRSRRRCGGARSSPCRGPAAHERPDAYRAALRTPDAPARGPAIAGRATGAALVPVFSFREGRYTYRVVVRPPITVARTADREADVAEAVQRLAAEIEWAIRRAPHHGSACAVSGADRVQPACGTSTRRSVSKPLACASSRARVTVPSARRGVRERPTGSGGPGVPTSAHS